MEAQEVKSEKMTLCDLIWGFMEFADDNGKWSFPPLQIYSTRPWHKFLYTLKESYTTRFPELECIGEFYWDGPYPRARNFDNVAYVLLSSFTCDLRDYDRRTCFSFGGKNKRKVNPLRATHLELLRTMYRVACETKGFFLNHGY